MNTQWHLGQRAARHKLDRSRGDGLGPIVKLRNPPRVVRRIGRPGPASSPAPLCPGQFRALGQGHFRLTLMSRRFARRVSRHRAARYLALLTPVWHLVVGLSHHRSQPGIGTLRKFRTAVLWLAAFALTGACAAAQWAVFDSANYAQNVLEASRALQQINIQIHQLQSQTAMLQDMGKNLTALPVSQLGPMVSSLAQISTLMNQAQGIAFTVNATDSAFAQSYPQTYAPSTTSGTLQADAHQRWLDTMAAFQRTLQVQAQVAQNVQSDRATLASLVTASQGAAGNLQVSQAANQLLALSVKQQLQIQNLIAAQDRASALDLARNAEAEEEGRAAFQRFIGSPQAYGPQ